MNSTLKSYIIGFVLSILLTVLAYYTVVEHLLSGSLFIIVLMGFGIVQLMVQLLFFLHLGQESKPRWNFIFFLSTVGIILLVIVGSIWIMSHLNYNMTPQKINEYSQSQDGL